MSELSEEEEDKMVNELFEKVSEFVDGHRDNIITEAFAYIMADMLMEYPIEQGIPLMLNYMSNVLEKAYGVEADIQKMGMMQ
jgi:uncharacterized protein YbaR (Trm112 family)